MSDAPVRRSTDSYVTHDEFAAFRDVVTKSFDDIKNEIRASRQPFTAYAGVATVILTLVAAVLWPQLQADKRHSEAILALQANQLQDARTRGQFEEKFVTLREQVNAALVNRQDMHARLSDATSAMAGRLDSVDDELRSRIDQVAHSLDNGLGRRIDEKLAPVYTTLEMLRDRNPTP